MMESDGQRETGKKVTSDPDQGEGRAIAGTGLLHVNCTRGVSHATLLLLEGVPVHVVANRLGHSDPAVTLRVYAHVLRVSVAGVADVFAKAVERAGVSKSVSKKVAEYNETRGSTL